MPRCPHCHVVLNEWEGGSALYWCTGLNGCGEYFDRNADGSVGPVVVDSSVLLPAGATFDASGSRTTSRLSM
jgi:hypothetical protein